MATKVARSPVHEPVLKYSMPSQMACMASCVCPQNTRSAPRTLAREIAPDATFGDSRSHRVLSRSISLARKLPRESSFCNCRYALVPQRQSATLLITNRSNWCP